MNYKKINIPKLVFIILILVGISIMLYPITVGYINSTKETKVINDYSQEVEKLASSKYKEILDEANKYNQTLTNDNIIDAFKNNNKETILKEEYVNQLNINNDDVMGYIKIPKIDVSIPIYHGTSTKVLQKGVGHFEGSSLPVGGESTHSILSGHRGLPSSRLFSDLNQLVVGDMFYIYVLDQVLAYKVDQILVVEPSNIDNLKIEDNQDYITLVTCTPYAINTHRLLVRGTRVEYNEEVLESITPKRQLSTPDIILIIGLSIGLIIIVISIIIINKINKKSKNKIQLVNETIELPKIKEY